MSLRRLQRAASRLEGLPGLVGAFRGVRRRDRTWTSEETLTCYVRRKTPLARLPRDERILPRLDGVPTDVIAIGRPRLHADVDASDQLIAIHDDTGRKSAVSALARHPSGGIVALGSGHGLLPIQGGGYVAGRWGAGARKVGVFREDGISPGALWFGAIGDDRDFAVVRFPQLAPPAVLVGHTLAGAPIAEAPRRVRKHAIVQHVAAHRGYRVTGRVVAEPIPGRPITLRSSDGLDLTYRDVITVAGEHVRFSVPGESGSLVFDEHRRAIGFVIGGGRDPDDPTLDVTFVLRDFAALRADLEDLYGLFFTRSVS